METTLVINIGSSSKKYALYSEEGVVLDLRFEHSDSGFEMCSRQAGAQQVCESVKAEDFSNAFERVAEDVKHQLMQEAVGKKLDRAIIRVVAPGTFFQKHGLIDEEYEKELHRRESSAPLHVPHVIREIDAVKKFFPGTPLIAASDSAFHSDMPPRAREYSIVTDDVNEYDIHRFGYHGLSVSSVVRRLHPLIGQDPERLIVCHIGSGASVTAVKNGKSIETTMGFSPSSGLPMGSRAGDLDAAALLELMRAKGMKPRDAELYINTNGGLAAIAKDADIRQLLDRRSKNDAAATRALDIFAYHIQRAIAAQSVALGGLDVLVLTATASVRSSELRGLVLDGLTHLGVQISKDRNDLLVGKDGIISVRNSDVKVVVMRTDEMGEMAFIAQQVDV